MTNIEPVHDLETGRTVQRVTLDDGSSHEFELLEGGADYQHVGDGDPPEKAVAALVDAGHLEPVDEEDVEELEEDLGRDGAIDEDAPESYQQ